MSRLLKPLKRDRRGMAAVEFAIILPFLILMLMGTVEVGRYVYLHLKLQNTAGNIADIVSRPNQVAASDLSKLFTATPVMLTPFEAGERVRVLVSGVVVPDPDDPPEVAWQADGGGSLTAASEVGGVGDPANVPGGLVFFGGDAVIVTEVVYDYQPWLMEFVGGSRIRKTAYFRPPRGTLAAIN